MFAFLKQLRRHEFNITAVRPICLRCNAVWLSKLSRALADPAGVVRCPNERGLVDQSVDNSSLHRVLLKVRRLGLLRDLDAGRLPS